MRNLAFKILVAGTLAATMAAPAWAAPEGHVTYVVKRADTLHELTDDFLVNSAALKTVQRANQIKNPRLMQVGQTLRIPRRLLKHRSVDLTLQGYSGDISLTAGELKLTPRVGLALREGVMSRSRC